MRRDNLRRVQIESSNRETQPASEIGVGLAQQPASLNIFHLVHLYLQMNDGGMGLGRRAGSRPLQGSTGLHDVPALFLGR